MIKNLAYLFPNVGRISMGEVVREEGKSARPRKNDFFTITTQAKIKGVWVEHPIAKKLTQENDKLRVIPIRVLFDKVDLNLNESYAAFDDKGRQLCRGDGATAHEMSQEGKWEEVTCPGADYCKRPQAKRCALLGRFDFSINDPENPDDFKMEAFALRTSGYNTVRAIRSKLELFHAAFGGLRGLPLKLVMRSKSSKASLGSNFYYADVDLDCSFMEGASKVTQFKDAAANAGLNLAAMDEMYQSLVSSHVRETGEDVEEFEEIGTGTFTLGSGWHDGQEEFPAEECQPAGEPISDWRKQGVQHARQPN